MQAAQIHFSFSRLRLSEESLTGSLGRPVSLSFTDNTSTMLTVRRRLDMVEVRIHRMFEWVEPATYTALVQYCRKGRGKFPELNRHVEENRHLVRERKRRLLPGPDDARGKYFDLLDLLSRVHKEFFPDLPPAAITWGRPGRGRQRIQLAVYDPESHLIRVNPRMDREWVPTRVMEFLIYHELCHAWLIRQARSEGRRDGHHHNRRFRELEQRFPGYAGVMDWERQNSRRI